MTEDLLTKLIAAVCYSYNSDGTCPNVTISKLKNGNYYASVVRYIGGRKKVMCKSENKQLQTCLSELSKKFLATNPPPVVDPLQSLHHFMTSELGDNPDICDDEEDYSDDIQYDGTTSMKTKLHKTYGFGNYGDYQDYED